MASVNIAALDASLKVRKAAAQKLMVKRMTAGWDKLRGFRKLRVTDRIVLGSLVVNSLAQPGAKGAFNPKANALAVQARIAQVRPAKIDLLITETERLELEANYFAEVEGTNGRDPNKFMFSDYVWEYVVEQAGIDTVKAVWTGDYNPTGTTAVDVCDGLVTLIDADIVSDALPESLIQVHSATDFFLSEDNIIEEIKALVKIYRTKLPAYAYQPATLYLAPERLAEYEFALEQLNGEKNTYNAFKQQVLYFAKNIVLEPVLELAGTDFMGIVPDDNVVYLTDRQGDKIELNSDYQVRDRSLALVADWWFAPNYVRADIMVVNDLRERPEEAAE
jgi:hypothetical protein